MDVPVARSSECVIGITIPLPEPWAAQVTRVRSRAGDPFADHIAPHVTIVPPTLIERDCLEDLRTHLRRVAARTAPIRLHMAGTESFRPVSPVTYLVVASGAEQCDELHRRVRSQEGPLHRPPRFPFHPHVTLAQGVSDDALDATAQEGSAIDAVFIAQNVHLHLLTEDGAWMLLEAPELAGLDTPKKRVATGAP